jgi:hypothetical protein
MGIGKFLIACVLCVGGVSAASAMDADGQDLSSMQRGLDSGASSHEGGSAASGGDALGVQRETQTPSSSSSSSSGSDNCPGPNPASPMRNRRANLGWQSLLPGSIQ